MSKLDRPSVPTCSDGPIWNVWLAAFHAPALAIADELGMFRALRDRPATAAELAVSLDIEVRAIETLAGLMSALEFLIQADGRFHLTDVARHYLVPDSPYYWGGFLQRIRALPLDCSKLIAGLRRGHAAQEARVTAGWEVPEPPAAALESFTHAMHAHSFALAMRITPALELSNVETLLDVAGGSGSYSIAAALRNPRLKCSVLDLPAVCAVASKYIEKFAISDQVTVVPANMFRDPWPTGYERVFLSDIFHDWDDARCHRLAAHAYESLSSGGKVVIHEMILSDSKDGPLHAVAYSMVMVFVAQGRQRSARELTEILLGAGFVDIQPTMTSGGYAAITGTKP
ncbi:MAG: O-methyltransferase [Myxococcales bacterium]|nr:O-methyltransferase [Myxococcales bacterium]